MLLFSGADTSICYPVDSNGQTPESGRCIMFMEHKSAAAAAYSQFRRRSQLVTGGNLHCGTQLDAEFHSQAA